MSEPRQSQDMAVKDVRITNCHIHTFTADHVPDRYAGIGGYLLRIRPIRLALLRFLRAIGRTPRNLLVRYARILEISHLHGQAEIFEIAQGFYPKGTRFVVLPMDMEYMNAGRVRETLAEQHNGLRALRESFGKTVLPFAAVDPRRPNVVRDTIVLLESGDFFGIKLYPPIGYHPNDPRLGELYDYAAEHGIPVLSHCTRRGVHYRGKPHNESDSLADPDNYKEILSTRPTLRLCLAHFGGDQEWQKYVEKPWLSGGTSSDKSWLAKIADMIRSDDFDNLYTDIAYTIYADEGNVYLLRVLLSDPNIRRRVLFGSDFYVVENALLEERRVAVKVRAVLGEDLFRQIAEINPAAFLGVAAD